MRGMSPLRVGVIFGGRSGEHEVSLASAASVIAALERRGHAVVPIGIARDGRWVVGGDPLRALAAQARAALPQNGATGPVKKASAVSMDKATMKAVFQAHGLPIVKYTVVLRHEWRAQPAVVLRRVKEVTGFPC